jgi:hypothetical protein
MLGRWLRPGDAIVGDDIAESRAPVLFEGPGWWRRGRSSSNDTFRSAGCVFRRSFIGARGIFNSDGGASYTAVPFGLNLTAGSEEPSRVKEDIVGGAEFGVPGRGMGEALLDSKADDGAGR